MLPKNAAEPERRAAQVLQFYLQKIVRAEVPILSGGKPTAGRGAIFIGKHPDLKKRGLQAPLALPPDAYFLESKNQVVQIVGGGDMGAEYGVYTLLEKLGCRKYTPRDSLIPEIRDLRLPDIAPTLDAPAFPYRELWYEPAFDEGWARWHKLKTNRQKNEEWGLFVHTFHRLCPPEEHFKANPEFFAWNGRQRSSGQICLSNDTVRRIVVENLRRKIAEKPGARIWSLSQNDNFDYCKCPRCAASDVHLGGPAGTLLAFVNAVAAEFPDKIISTLAYQYTRQAPRGIRPAANVSVCLCSIECNRGLPLTEDKSSAGFVRDVQEWSQLTDNLMIWDYVVQFRSYLSPFPNWHTLQPNLQFFKKHGTKMMFEQGSGRSRSEFSDMRAYLLAGLMWNPDANMDSILTDFGRHVYGAAQPFIWQYIDTLTKNLLNTDRQLQIYGTPLTPAKTWLDERAVNTYFDILGRATQVVTDPSPEADRLSEAMLPMLHVLFEQIKIRDWWHPCPDTAQPGQFRFCYLPAQYMMVQNFPALCQQFGYETMHENNFPPARYAEEVLKFMREGRVLHRFMQFSFPGRTTHPIDLQLLEAASPTYESGRATVLLDTRRGTTDYHYNWLGFEGTDMVATLRLPDSIPDERLPLVSTVSVQFLQDQASWVFFPEKVMVEFSEDGQNFRPVRTESLEIVPDGQKSVRKVSVQMAGLSRLRAVRVSAINQKKCPAWHPGNGNRAWIFADEIVVD